MNKTIKKTKRFSRHKVTFEDSSDARAIALAQLGQSNKSIKFETTGLTDGKISYRMAKYKRLVGDREGLRSQWRNGNSKLFRQIMEDVVGVLEQELKRTVVPMIVKPTPETTK